MIRQRINTEKVLSIDTKGLITNYPQQNIIFKKKKIEYNNLLNKPTTYITSEYLLKSVETAKLNKSYEKRIKNMMYKASIMYWKEFEAIWLHIFDKIDLISTEGGNTLKVVKKIEKEEFVIGLA